MNKLRLVLAGLLLAGFGYLAYVTLPRTREITYTVTKPVKEQRSRSYGQPREVTVPIPYTVTRMVPQQRTRSVLPTVKEWFQFVVVALIVLTAFAIAWILLFHFYRIKKAGGPLTIQDKDTLKRVDIISSTFFGILIGVAGVKTFYEPQPRQPPPTQQQIDATNDDAMTDAAPPADEVTSPLRKYDQRTRAVGDAGTPDFRPNPPK
jgi:hypothetical protein